MKSSTLYIYNILMSLLPETRCFGVKRFMLRLAGAEVGKNVRISSSALFIGTGKLYIGDNTWIGPRCIISASSSIKIGRDCDIAPNVYIGTGTHEITPMKDRIADIETSKDIIIENGCWICVNSTILPGVIIGEKSVIAAGAVVTKNVDDMSLVGGIPAKLIKKI